MVFSWTHLFTKTVMVLLIIQPMDKMVGEFCDRIFKTVNTCMQSYSYKGIYEI